MEALKKSVFKVCAGLTTIPQFEEWMYHDVEVQCSILENDDVLRLCSIDFSKGDALYELNKFCLEVYNKEEFYVYVIEHNAKQIIETNNENEILEYVRNISHYSGWDDSKHLFHALYYLEIQLEEYPYIGMRTKREIFEEMKFHAEMIVDKFKVSTLEEKKNWVFEGLRRDDLIIHPHSIHKIKYERPKQSKRWYQFWK